MGRLYIAKITPTTASKKKSLATPTYMFIPTGSPFFPRLSSCCSSALPALQQPKEQPKVPFEIATTTRTRTTNDNDNNNHVHDHDGSSNHAAVDRSSNRPVGLRWISPLAKPRSRLQRHQRRRTSLPPSLLPLQIWRRRRSGRHGCHRHDPYTSSLQASPR